MSVSVDMRIHICIHSSEAQGKGKNHRGLEEHLFSIVIQLVFFSLTQATCTGSTIKPYLCSQEHKHRWIVLPGAQIRLDCAPGDTLTQATWAGL